MALSSAATAQTTVAGSTSAQFSVSNGGAATYRIPIAVPPGVAGMSPRLELAYSSQGGNGSMGMGWGLSGLSAISRCAKTMANDGVRGNVGFDLNDAYCLNGRRLILVSGTHGAAGAQYRSLQESFSTITAYGSAGSGPAYFIEKSKAGLTTEYGNTADSRIEAQGKPTARTWAQNKVSDVKGNYMSFGYTEDTANGDYNLNRVDYSGNASATPALAPGMSVQLTYQSRPDTPTGYHQGSIIKSTQRATNIKTYTGTTLVKDYRLTYEQSSHTQRSRMKTVKECDGSGGCLQPIELQWPAVANGLVTPTAEVIPRLAGNGLTHGVVSLGTEPAKYRLFADFNGDGKTDYMWMSGNVWMIVYATETGFTAPVVAFNASPETSNGVSNVAPMMTVGDFNGDGKMDFMWLPASGGSGTLGWMMAYSTGNGFTTPTAEVIPKNASSGPTYGFGTEPAKYRLFADFNGDGKTDYMWFTGSSWVIAYATETGFTTPVVALPNYFTGSNGAYIHATPEHSTYGFTGPSSAAVTVVTGEISPVMAVGDFNGDGKTDFMWLPLSDSGASGTLGWMVAYSPPGNDTVSSFTNGPGTTVSVAYKPITHASVYTKDSGANAAVFPYIDIVAPFHVVASVATANGLGGVNTSDYSYGGLKVERGSGRGMLGFRWTKSKEQATGIESYTEYRQDHPYTGMPIKSETRLAGAGNAGVLKRNTSTPACKIPLNGAACVIQSRCDLSSNSVACKAAADSRYFTYAASSQEESWDLNGAAFPSITSTTTYGLDPVDGKLYGDPSQISVTTSDGSSKTTLNEYWPADTVNWILGRLKKATVTSVKP